MLVPRLTKSLTLSKAQLLFLPKKELKYIYKGHRTKPQGHYQDHKGHRIGPQGHYQDYKDTEQDLKDITRTIRTGQTPKNQKNTNRTQNLRIGHVWTRTPRK